MLPNRSFLFCLVTLLTASFSFAGDATLLIYEKSPKEHLGELILNHNLNAAQKQYVGSWRVADPSWWRNPRRNSESLMRFNRILNLANHPDSTAENLRGHEELFGITVLPAEAAGGHQGWLQIDHRLRPDLLVFEKRILQHLAEVYQSLGGKQAGGGRLMIDSTRLTQQPWFVDEQGKAPSAQTVSGFTDALKRLFPRSQSHHLDGAETLADLHTKMQACNGEPAGCFSDAMWRLVKNNFTQQQNRVNRFLAAIDGPLADRLVRHVINETYSGNMLSMIPIVPQGLPEAYLATYQGETAELAQQEDRLHRSSFSDGGDRINSFYRVSLLTYLVDKQPAFKAKKQRSAGPRRLSLDDFLTHHEWKTVVDYGLSHHGVAYLFALRGQALDVQMQFKLSMAADNRTAVTRRTEGKRNYHPDFTLPDTLVEGSAIRHDQTLSALFGDAGFGAQTEVSLSVAPLIRLYPKPLDQRKQPLVTMGNVWHERVQLEEVSATLFQGRINNQNGTQTFLLPLLQYSGMGFPETRPVWEAQIKSNEVGL